jgi:hypothetical protein
MNTFLFHILPIIHAYNASISRLWSYAQLRSEDMTLVVYPDSIALPTLVDVMTPVVSLDPGHASRLLSMSMPHVLPPQMWKTSHGQARWLQYLIAQTLNRKRTGRDAWLIHHLKPQLLTASHVQEVGHVPCDQKTLSPTWSEKNPSIQKHSVPLQLRRIKAFECMVRWAKVLCLVTMALRTDHT